MPKLDANIYGTDTNDFASGIAADALGTPDTKSPIDQSALSRGVDDKGPNPDVVITHSKSDGRAKSKGNN